MEEIIVIAATGAVLVIEAVGEILVEVISR